MIFYRQRRGYFYSWWWTVDKPILVSLLMLMLFSAIMVTTASPAVAERIGLESMYFIKKQMIYLSISLLVVISVSFLSVNNIKFIATVAFILCTTLLILVLFKGIEIKGAKRWIYIMGLSMQPSEFMKPFFAVITGYALDKTLATKGKAAFLLPSILYALVIGLIILQPDFGMVVTISTVWIGQLFLAGVPILLFVILIISAAFGLVGGYMFLPHVTQRIMNFLDQSNNENYQIKRSLEAFYNGGFYGRGPGEGTVKQFLPDSHTDFIFAVIGEELGSITCLLIILLFAFIVIRGFMKIKNESDNFIVLSTSGLLMQFGIQSIINIGVTMHLLPTKGMTLPFISYGGSSMIATSISAGIMLAMLKKRYGIIKHNNNGMN